MESQDSAIASRALDGLETAVKQWLAELDVSERTQDAYRKGIGRYVSYLQAQGLQGTLRTDILSYKAHLVTSRSAATVSAYLVPVRRFYTWLHATTGTPNLAADIKGAKASRGFKKDSLTPSQARKVLTAHSDCDSLKALRDSAIISLTVHTGVRTIELVRANVEDMHSAGESMVLDVHGKGRDSKDTFVVLPETVVEQINTYLKARGPVTEDAPLFASISPRNNGGRMTTRSISRIAKDTLIKAGYDSPRLTAHSVRHTAVTLALLGGATPQEAQAMARHSSINTTMIYAHNLDRVEHAAELKISQLLSASA